MLSATTHIGSENSETTMAQYIFKRRNDGVNIINLKKTWEKLMLSARAIAAIENPEDVYVVSSRAYGQRACLKFARYIGATAIAGRFTPGMYRIVGNLGGQLQDLTYKILAPDDPLFALGF